MTSTQKVTPKILFENLSSLKSGELTSLKNSLISAIECAFLKKFSEGNDRPCDESDFEEEKKEIETHVSYIRLIIDDLLTNSCFFQNDTVADRQLLVLILILCGENVKHKLWNTECTVENCVYILKQICKFFKILDAATLVNSIYEKKLVNCILKYIQPKLLNGAWKCYPGAVSVYEWVLHILKQPSLSDHLQLVFPTALLLVDDFSIENRVLGLKCMQHIINNMTIAELKYHGHGNVIFSTIYPLLRVREIGILNEVMTCLVPLTSKMEVQWQRNLTTWSRFDDVLEVYLESMEMENIPELRKAYLKNFLPFIKTMGLPIVRWTKRLLRILCEYLTFGRQTCNECITNNCLKVIQAFLKTTMPALTTHKDNLFFILLVGLYNCKVNQHSLMQRESEEIAIHNIKLLMKYTSESEKKSFSEFLEKEMSQINNNNNFFEQVMSLVNS